MEDRRDGQLALIEAIGKVVDLMGGAVAGSIAAAITDGLERSGLDKLQDLQNKAAETEELKEENGRLRKELEHTKIRLEEALASVTQPAVLTPISGNVLVGKTRTVDDHGEPVPYEVLAAKAQDLKNHNKDLTNARAVLEKKIRSVKSDNRGWMRHADGLQKINLKLMKVLDDSGIQFDRNDYTLGYTTIDKSPASTTLTNLINPNGRIVDSNTKVSLLRSRESNVPELLETFQLSNSDTLRPDHGDIHAPQTRFLKKPKTPANQHEHGKQPLEDDVPPNPVIDNDENIKGASNTLVKPGNIQSNAGDIANPEFRTPTTVRSSVYDIPPDTHQPPPSANKNSTQDDHEYDEALEDHMTETVQIPIKCESQESPVVVSCRTVKKNRNRPESVASAPVKIKLETLSSSPIGLAVKPIVDINESFDLDNVGVRINTPKKKKNHGKALLYPHNINSEDSRSRALGIPSALKDGRTNAIILPRTSSEKSTSKRRKLNDLGAVILGEDGEQDGQDRPAARHPPAASEHRLTSLLEEMSPKGPILTPKFMGSSTVSTPMTSTEMQRSTASARSLRHPAMSSDPKLRENRREKYSVTGSHPFRAQADQSSTLLDESGDFSCGPEDEPLRARPLHKLGLSDFKINSTTNNGYDFAFSEVVRGREQRKCLPGCTRTECCGQAFRKLAEFTTRQNGHLTLSQEDRDQELLRDFLGNNAASLRAMTENDKQELLLQAKARDMANKHGRHRHAYNRAQSPPGFWRTDFPSTQELNKDRIEASSREKDMIKDRYMEAMRHGGVWKFADE